MHSMYPLLTRETLGEERQNKNVVTHTCREVIEFQVIFQVIFLDIDILS